MTGFHLTRGECHYLSVKPRRSCFRERKDTLTKSKNGLVDLGTTEATGFAKHGLLQEAKHRADRSTTCQGRR